MQVPALVVAQLIAQYGLPLAAQIVQWVHEGKTVSPEDFALLETIGKYRSADALKAAGISIVDGKVVVS